MSAVATGEAEILVAGFHRSGTSSVAQLLHAAGLFVGDDLIGALPTNPYGHFEDREVVRIHDRILLENGLTWQVAEEFVPRISPPCWQAIERYVERRRLEHRLWGFKDPRVCLFLPAWKHVMPDAKVLITFRSVADCASSLARRHGRELAAARGPHEVHRRFFTVPDLAARMWLVHNRALVDFARRHPEDVLTVSFDGLLRGLPLTRLLRQAWGAPLREIPTFTTLDPLATTARDSRQPISDPALPAALDAVYAELLELERQTLDLSARLDGKES
jgi:Sulfotransferase family